MAVRDYNLRRVLGYLNRNGSISLRSHYMIGGQRYHPLVQRLISDGVIREDRRTNQLKMRRTARNKALIRSLLECGQETTP